MTFQNTKYYTNIIKVSLSVPSLSSSVFGINQWNLYAHKGKSITLTNLVYKGFYTDTALDINTSASWAANLSPSYAASYAGCPTDTNNFTIDLRRKGFDVGMYQLKIPSHDQEVRVKKNGNLIFSALCCNTNPAAINLGTISLP